MAAGLCSYVSKKMLTMWVACTALLAFQLWGRVQILHASYDTACQTLPRPHATKGLCHNWPISTLSPQPLRFDPSTDWFACTQRPCQQVWPFTQSRFATQHCHGAVKGKALREGLNSSARQVPLVSLLKSITIRHTKEVLQLPDKTVEDVPGGWRHRRTSHVVLTCVLL